MKAFEHIILKTELTQSESFGEIYSNILEDKNPTLCSPLIEDIGEMLNSILVRYDTLTEFQEHILAKIFNEFNRIQMEIDPKRLKPFEHYFNSDDELLLFRKTDIGLTNITINPEECISYSFIPKNFNEERKFYFLDQEGDFEILSYDFLSK